MGNLHRACVTFAALAACLSAAPAAAQYYLTIEPGYDMLPVAEEEWLSIASPHPLVLAAGEASSLRLDGLFTVEGGMRRFFGMEWDAVGDAEYLVEYELVPHEPWTEPEAEPVEYGFDDGEIMIGFGGDPADEWGPYIIASYFVSAEDEVEELARWECGANYSFGVYALDLNADGVVELVAPWATGAGGGGGVELMAVVPTGGLAGWGEDGMSGSFWSANGATELADYDGDGDWELASSFPLLFSAAGYYYTDVLTFDREVYAWVAAREIAADFYAEQEGFYHELAEHVRAFVEDPEAYRSDDPEGWNNFVCEIGGEEYALDPFATDDEGTPDEFWVEEFLALVETMGE